MAEMMLALGPYRFSIDSAAYQDSVQQDAYDWRAQPQIGQRPALQFVGHRQTRDLAGVIYPFHRGGFGQLDRMRNTALLGLPLPLIAAAGRVLGAFVILSVREEQTIFDQRGAPRRQDFMVRLERYDGGLRALLPI